MYDQSLPDPEEPQPEQCAQTVGEPRHPVHQCADQPPQRSVQYWRQIFKSRLVSILLSRSIPYYTKFWMINEFMKQSEDTLNIIQLKSTLFLIILSPKYSRTLATAQPPNPLPYTDYMWSPSRYVPVSTPAELCCNDSSPWKLVTSALTFEQISSLTFERLPLRSKAKISLDRKELSKLFIYSIQSTHFNPLLTNQSFNRMIHATSNLISCLMEKTKSN